MVSLCLPVKDLSEDDSKKVRKENQTLELDALEPSCKDVGSLYFDVICDSIAKKEISSAALVRDESMDSLFYDANEDIESSFRNDNKVRDKLSPTTVEGVIPGTKCSNLMNIARALNIFPFRQELPETESKGSSMIRESNVEFFSNRTPLPTARLEAQSASEMLGAIENGSSLRKGHEPINILPLGIEMVSLCLPVKDVSENDSKKIANIDRPQNLYLLQLQTRRTSHVGPEKKDCIENRYISNTIFPGSEIAGEILTPGKENSSPNTLLLNSLKKKGKRDETQLPNSRRPISSKVTISPYKQPEEEMIASPDKENQRPLKFLQQTKLAIPASKNQVKFKQDMVLEDSKVERVPLQSLLVNFSGNSCSVPNDTTRNGISVNFSQIMRKSNLAGDGKRRWTMVGDTASLVGKESRKSLQLLQGLKGTHMVIPKMDTQIAILFEIQIAILFEITLALADSTFKSTQNHFHRSSLSQIYLLGENLLATESKPAEVKMYQDENLMANERESVEKKGSLEMAGKDDEKYQGENLLATESKPAEVKMYQDENLMANERESVEKKGSLEVAGKDDEQYQTMDSISV
ncbi:hypothetical protein SADUNF_Sadunf17G0074500 [Salix dunnii]|uniref:Uncharacterized protein n=1 Tax=Salix dunnii TaxID=1413687 RepID=A0A835J5D5_9ROSI|nr:hypothetical protein SADUNF_Sadunf17G0074500 [Salix dunnii]